jgi:hypothetical protein
MNFQQKKRKSKYNPDLHHRQSIRLRGYDYTQQGAYFVTICTYERVCLFGDVMNGVLQFSRFGEIAIRCWQAIPEHFQDVHLDEFIVMPNHVHGILVLTDNSKDTALSLGARPKLVPLQSNNSANQYPVLCQPSSVPLNLP